MRFIPDGYEGLERATIRIAKARDPALWEENSFVPGEAAVWAGFGTKFGTVQPDYVLGSELGLEAVKIDSPVFWRVQSYWWAQEELRQALFAGRVLGEFLDHLGQQNHIRREDWATESGEWVLAQGYAYFDPKSDMPTTVFVRSGVVSGLISATGLAAGGEASTCAGKDADIEVSPPTSAEELRLIKHLAQLLESNSNLSKSEAAAALGVNPRSRPFELRIWPRGRKAAGLHEQAKAGRKSSR